MQEHRDEKHLKQMQEKEQKIQSLQQALNNEREASLELEGNISKVRAENIRLMTENSSLQNLMRKQKQTDVQVKAKFEQQTN